MKLLLLPVLVLVYFYFTVAENIIVNVNQIGERVERSQNRTVGRSPSLAFDSNNTNRRVRK